MQPEDIRVAMRSRHGWEAVDLGFRMARTWWRPLFGAWLAVVWPVALLLHLLLIDHIWVASLLVWWLKPAFDRVALFVLSESLFGPAPSVRRTLAALPALLRTGMLHSLLWLRLTPQRSFSLPVLQLEGARGPARRERTRLLIGREGNAGMGLFVACVHFELVLFVAGVYLLWSFLPEPSSPSFLELLAGEAGFGGELTSSLLYVICMSIVEPFYVAGGFALYINRRMYLEGWDIDLVFKRLVKRVATQRAATSAAALLPALLLLVLLGSAPVAAQEPDEEADAPSCEASAQGAAACITVVLADPEFGATREVSFWAPKWDDEAPAEEAGTLLQWLTVLARGLAVVVEALAWAALGIAAGVLAWLLLRRLRDAEPVEPTFEPEVLFGLDVRPESLPDDVVAAAYERWAARDAIGAMSLLYRASLVYLTRVRGVAVPASATEGECTRIASRSVDEVVARDFAELSATWQGCAYGRREPAEATFTDLCRRWRAHLERPAEAAS